MYIPMPSPILPEESALACSISACKLLKECDHVLVVCRKSTTPHLVTDRAAYLANTACDITCSVHSSINIGGACMEKNS